MMDTKQQGEHIEHSNQQTNRKKQAKYKKHFRLRYYFPIMSIESEMSNCSSSWREESTEIVDRPYQDEPLPPPPPPPDARFDVEDDEETAQDGLSPAVLEARNLRQVAVESW